MNKKIVTVVVVFFAVILVAVGFAAFHMVQTQASVATKVGAPIPVRVRVVDAGPIGEVLGTEGYAVENSSVPIRSTITSRVVKVHAELGDKVFSGQRLIDLDPTLQRSAVSSGGAQHASAKITLERAVANLKRAHQLYKQLLISEDELTKAILEESKARFDLAGVDNKLAQSNYDLSASQVDAPVSGIITDRQVHPGVIAKSASDMLIIANIDPVLIYADMSEDKFKYVWVGQDVEVSFYAFPGRSFSGKVAIIKPQVDQKSRLFSVIVRLANPTLEILPGMHGVVRLKNNISGVRVPTIALMSPREDTAYVFVVDDKNVAYQRTIKTGSVATDYIEVKQGLSVGDRVVVVGQSGLTDKSKVRIGDEFANKK